MLSYCYRDWTEKPCMYPICILQWRSGCERDANGGGCCSECKIIVWQLVVEWLKIVIFSYKFARYKKIVPLQPNYRKISCQITEKYRAKLPKNIAPNYRKIFLITMNQQITNRYYSHEISIIQDGSHRYRSACLPPPRRWCLCHSYWLYETLSSSGVRVVDWLRNKNIKNRMKI